MIELLEQAIQKAKQLPESEQARIAQLIFREIDNLSFLLSTNKPKLSEVLLLPELADDEIIFERDTDTGRDIIL